ncbi:MAG: RDD family protein [Bryobacteraceae bacterium]
MDKLRIQTPEGISFSFLLASPVSRMLAWLIDFGCILGITTVAGQMLSLLSVVSKDLAQAAYLMLYFVVSIGYGIVFEFRWRGQTPGKRVLRLRVLDARGLHLALNQIVLRNLLRAIDSLPFLYAIGGVVSLLNRYSQRLGDLAGNTIVIRNPAVVQPDLDKLIRGRFNSLLSYPHLAARLRHLASPQAAGIGLEALTRREELDPPARVTLFGEIAAHYRALVEFPPEVTEQISDEQYVRNVVEILFRTA